MSSIDKKLIKSIRMKGGVTSSIRNQYFPELTVPAIRDVLEQLGFDRHMPVDVRSTEIALVLPDGGVLMQIRQGAPNRLGLWGGVVEYGESYQECAVRELFEETGIEIEECQLEFDEKIRHYYQYDNGDQVYFTTHRYIVRLQDIPEIAINSESTGAVTVYHTILSHQQDFVSRVLGEK